MIGRSIEMFLETDMDRKFFMQKDARKRLGEMMIDLRSL